jgi:hypothetical protein
MLVVPELMAYVDHGGIIPNGWGVAWREWNRDAVLIMPVPFNLIARVSRRVWRRIGLTVEALR